MIENMKKKKPKTEYVHFSPFDKELFDQDYIKKLSPKDRKYLLDFSKENINGMIVDGKESVFNDSKARKERLKVIKADPELYADFKEAKEKYDKKNKIKSTELEFVKKYWQQEANRYKHRRRQDAYSRLINRKFEEIKNAYVDPIYNSPEYIAEEEEFREKTLSEAHENNQPNEDIQEFLYYRKKDRLDKYIWLRLGEIIQKEKTKNKHFEMMEKDISLRNEEFENKRFTRIKYMIYLYSCLVICETFANQKDSLVIVKELRNIFDLIIYPRNDKMKLQEEKN